MVICIEGLRQQTKKKRIFYFLEFNCRKRTENLSNDSCLCSSNNQGCNKMNKKKSDYHNFTYSDEPLSYGSGQPMHVGNFD